MSVIANEIAALLNEREQLTKEEICLAFSRSESRYPAYRDELAERRGIRKVGGKTGGLALDRRMGPRSTPDEPLNLSPLERTVVNRLSEVVTAELTVTPAAQSPTSFRTSATPKEAILRFPRIWAIAGCSAIIVSCGGASEVTAPPPPPPPPPPAVVHTVVLSASTTTLTVGDATFVTVVLKDADGNSLSGRPVTWSSSASTVATVSGTGQVIAVAVGTATISASSEGRTGTILFSVTPAPVASVSLTSPAATIAPGQSTQIIASLRDAKGVLISGRTLSWNSSNSAAATVDNAGLVTGVASGTTTITGSIEGKSGAILISVASPTVATVEITPGSLSMSPGQSATVTAIGRDNQHAPISGRGITWSTNAPAVANIAVDGRVTAVAQGTALITATIDGILGSITVTVSAIPVSYVTLSPVSVSLTLGDVTVLVATPRDQNSNPLSGRMVTWTTSNATVVDGYTYAEQAVITGIQVGLSTVTATSEGKSAQVVVSVTPPPIPDVCAQIAGAIIVGSDGQYLGSLTNRYNAQSAFNEFGQFGSPYGTNSTNNQYGQYGSPYSSLSAWNSYASRPPILVKNGFSIAYYTVNTFKSPRVSPAFAATCNFP